MKLRRPMPPDDMAFGVPAFAPIAELDDFVRSTFLDQASPLCIEEHEHLLQARIGYLWAGVEAVDKGREILGTAQLLTPPQKKWSSLRARFQLEEWFGSIDFLITLSAPYCLECSDAHFLALLDHELMHCHYQVEFDSPKLGRDGIPMWAVRAHDVEQFVGVVARWGARAAGVEQLVRAAQKKPRFTELDIDEVMLGCGTCRKAA
jgi:hypothetical protein